MNIGFELKNREREIVAQAIIYGVDDTYSEEELDNFFSDNILEFAWQEDQSEETALEILKCTLMDVNPFANCALYSNGIGNSEVFVKRNFYRRADLNQDYTTGILLLGDLANINGLDYWISRAIEREE